MKTPDESAGISGDETMITSDETMITSEEDGFVGRDKFMIDKEW